MCRLLVVQQERLIEKKDPTGQSVPCPWRVLRVHPCQPLQYPKVPSAAVKAPECASAGCKYHMALGASGPFGEQQCLLSIMNLTQQSQWHVNRSGQDVSRQKGVVAGDICRGCLQGVFAKRVRKVCLQSTSLQGIGQTCSWTVLPAYSHCHLLLHDKTLTEL